MPTLQQLHASGVSVWLDDLSQQLLRSGQLSRLIDLGLRGETSNPTIFEKAITHGHLYDAAIRKFSETTSAETIVWNLMIEDVAEALQHFALLFESTGGRDGFVSLELHPQLANDTNGSIAQARELRQRLPQRNLMVKVPATEAGVPVIRTLTEEGFNVNVTLLFSVARYGDVMEAYISGLEARVRRGEPVDRIASVASFFVSRVDTEVDRRLEAHPGLRGRAAVANARVAYQRFENAFCGERWERLAAQGARVQRPLWASTSTKNPA
ncbi:MAG: transaldolase, partial [Candidatus Xenobia bacterium]